jgi:DNA-binding NarL/FixJ family response regulator
MLAGAGRAAAGQQPALRTGPADLGLPDGSGVDVVAALREKQPEVAVIVTIHDDDEHLFPPCRPAPSATC